MAKSGKKTTIKQDSEKMAEKQIAVVEEKVVEEVAEKQAPASEVNAPKVARQQIEKAVTSLQAYAVKVADQQKMLFEDSSASFTLAFCLGKIPTAETGARAVQYAIELPHPLWNDESEVCLMVKDPQRAHKDFLEANPVPAIKRVIDVKHWKQRFKTGIQKREVTNTYELFLCDQRIADMIPTLCGKYMLTNKNKAPKVVKLTGTTVQENIKKELRSTHYKITTGPSIGVRFGRVNFSVSDLLDNAMVVIDAIFAKVEEHGNWVKSIVVESTNCPALTIYKASAPKKLLAVASHAERKFDKKQEILEKEALKAARRQESRKAYAAAKKTEQVSEEPKEPVNEESSAPAEEPAEEPKKEVKTLNKGLKKLEKVDEEEVAARLARKAARKAERDEEEASEAEEPVLAAKPLKVTVKDNSDAKTSKKKSKKSKKQKTA